MKATEQYFPYFIMMYQVVRDDGNKVLVAQHRSGLVVPILEHEINPFPVI